MAEVYSFGYWVRRRRKALDLTQAELAGRIGCATVTIRRIEADERRPSRQVAERLAMHLELPSGEQNLFVQAARARMRVDRLPAPGTMPIRTVAARATPAERNLPTSLTSLFGREEDVLAIRMLLLRVDVRLVTLTGAPGIGKTRLALQVAASLLDQFVDGVCFVDLAPIRDPHLIPVSIARALAVQDTSGRPLIATLKEHLRGRKCLLLLDNFEHMLAAAPLIADLLAAAPRLTILVTSRATLHLSGEHEFVVMPLALPDLQHLPPVATLSQYSAIALFVARAQAVRLTFQVTSENARAIATICHRLDGLPLAIELAAARSKLFSPDSLLVRLEHRLPLLSDGPRDMPARQWALRTAIDWSYSLLATSEQTLFRRLAVFMGGCTLEAAEAVGRDKETKQDQSPHLLVSLSVLDGLSALIDQSLLRQVEGADGMPRFLMLETIREYALEQLEASGEAAVLRRRHAAYFLTWAKAAESDLYWPMEAIRLDQLAAEYDNLRAVLEWSCTSQGDAEVGLRVVGALPEFWIVRGPFSGEGQAWFARVLERCPDRAPALIQARAKALLGYGQLEWTQGAYARSSELLDQSLTLYQEVGDYAGEAQVLLHQGRAAFMQGDYDCAARFEGQSLALFRDLGNHQGIAWSLLGLGDVALGEADPLRAVTYFEEARILSACHAERIPHACSLYNLGFIALHQGDAASAEMFFKESLRLFRDGKSDECIAICLVGMALVAEAQGMIERAAKLSGVLATGQDSLQSILDPIDRAQVEAAVKMAHAHMDEGAFVAAWAIGQAMSLEQAITYALGNDG